MGKHDDQKKEKEEERRQGNGAVPTGTPISPKEPEGKHSAPEKDKE